MFQRALCLVLFDPPLKIKKPVRAQAMIGFFVLLVKQDLKRKIRHPVDAERA